MSQSLKRITLVLTMLLVVSGLILWSPARARKPPPSKSPALSLSAGQGEARGKEVKIYLWDANSNDPGLGLKPVTRRVTGAALLRLTLEMLFAGATSDEEARGLSSSTFGMKFEAVSLRKGLALVKFSQPKNQTNYGSQGPMIFAEAIEKTARQFPSVKKVKICAVGDTLIDSQLERPFSKCPK